MEMDDRDKTWQERKSRERDQAERKRKGSSSAPGEEEGRKSKRQRRKKYATIEEDWGEDEPTRESEYVGEDDSLSARLLLLKRKVNSSILDYFCKRTGMEMEKEQMPRPTGEQEQVEKNKDNQEQEQGNCGDWESFDLDGEGIIINLLDGNLGGPGQDQLHSHGGGEQEDMGHESKDDFGNQREQRSQILDVKKVFMRKDDFQLETETTLPPLSLESAGSDQECNVPDRSIALLSPPTTAGGGGWSLH